MFAWFGTRRSRQVRKIMRDAAHSRQQCREHASISPPPGARHSSTAPARAGTAASTPPEHEAEDRRGLSNGQAAHRC